MTDLTAYQHFLEAKRPRARVYGAPVDANEIHPRAKDFQAAVIRWAVEGGRRALFERFGLGKTLQQLEIMRAVLDREGGTGLIIAPLTPARIEFPAEASALGIPLRFVRTTAEMERDDMQAPGLYVTNYESVREGKIDTDHLTAVSLDEAAVLRGFGGTKTFREFMRRFEHTPYRFVATATPSPNEYIELLAYAAFLGIMDVGEAKTRFFKRNSEKADQLTIHPHKEEEFWLWVNSWAVFLQAPSDLGYSDEGYDLPPVEIEWVQVDSAAADAGVERDGQGKLLRTDALGVIGASREKRATLPARIAKVRELVEAEPDEHVIIWHDLEDERRALETAISGIASVYGSQDLDEREGLIADFASGRIPRLAAKPIMLGSGCNLQRHCARAIYAGVGFKFNDFIQSLHRIYRFLQTRQVRVTIVYGSSEAEVVKELQRKWKDYDALMARMSEIIRQYGLNSIESHDALVRSIGVTREVASGDGWDAVLNDTVLETASRDPNSIDGMILTSIPFGTQYEYTPSYNDFGHTDDDAHFWRQMEFLSPELFRVLAPGRVLAVHVKDRVRPGGMDGLGFQTVSPFHADAIQHYRAAGFAYAGMITIATDVVRENNQTYRLGWSEQCKDGSRMSVGMPEYVLLFRKPPTDRSNGYADTRVVKSKAEYTRGRWQMDAHAFWRSSGNRLLTAAELIGLEAADVFRRFRDWLATTVYDHERVVSLATQLDTAHRLPPGFMLLQPPSTHPDVWTDITRMRTLNGAQEATGREMHLCLARGSLVLTRGGYKPIQDVAIGDNVLTHRGRWRRVLAKQNTGVRRCVTVRAQGVPGLTLTPDHKLWTRAVRDLAWSKAHSKLEASRTEPTWVEAQHTVGSYINLQLPPVEDPAQSDERLWWIVGRWIADGHRGTRGDVVISCGTHEVDDLMAHLGDRAPERAAINGGAAQLRVKDARGALRVIIDRCGEGATGKRLPPEALTLPVPQARALLLGYLSGDGHHMAARRRWTASSVSKDLILGVAMLAQRVYGAVASIYPGRAGGEDVIQGRTVQTHPDWIACFDLPRPGGRRAPFVLDDGAWKKVRSVEDAGDVETWNLRVEEDESYTAEGCVVKNCPLQFDIVDRLIHRYTNPGEVVFDPFGGLMTVPLRALELGRRGLGVELNAQYWGDGVRYLRAAEEKIATPTLFDLDAVTQEAAE